MIKHLTQELKEEWLPELIKREGGFICWICKISLSQENCYFDILNNNKNDIRYENTSLACKICYDKKQDPNNIEERIMGLDKLYENERKLYVREKKLEKNEKLHDHKIIIPKEISINQKNYMITKDFLREKTENNGSIEFKVALNELTIRCKSQTDHGSQPAIRRYLEALTSDSGDYEVVRDINKKKFIVRRLKN